MKYLLVSLLALSVGTAAVAADSSTSASPPQNYPPCSKTVTDECMQVPGTHHMARTMKHHRHHRHHRAHKAPANKAS